MKTIAALFPLALLFAATAPARNSLPVLSEDQAMLLRCSAAFAIVAGDQQRGVKSAQEYPPLEARGKEFFVRASALLMDQLHATREQMQELLQQQVALLQQGSVAARDPAAYVDGVMQPCLIELEASGV